MRFRAGAGKRALSNWTWMLALLILALALTLYQADNYPPTVDEFASLLDSGWLHGGYTPAEIVDSLLRHSPAHMPGYYLLLGAWGGLTGYEFALARYLSILIYLLLLSLVYRLARDLVAAEASIFALVIVMSNAFFNYYIAHARNYSLFVLLCAAVLWLYLRLTFAPAQPTAKDLLALGGAIFALAMTHLFSATLLVAIGLFHVFAAPKNRRWLRIALGMAGGALACLPMALLVLSGYGTAMLHLESQALGPLEAMAAWLSLMLNNQAAGLLGLIALGLVIGARKGLMRGKAWLALLPLFLLALALAAAFTPLIRPALMRHQVDGWILLALVAAAGHYALYRWKAACAWLAVLWCLAGLHFQQSANWWHHVVLPAAIFRQPPIQALSRESVKAEPAPYLIGYPYDSFFQFALSFDGPAGVTHGITQRQYYFKRHGIALDATDDIADFAEDLGRQALYAPAVWHFYQESADTESLAEAASHLAGHSYRHCNRERVGFSTLIDQYMWAPLNCQPPAIIASSRNALIQHDFYALGHNADGSTLLFIDKWAPTTDFDQQSYQMSYQLIDADWNNVAQLDLPLTHGGELRQFSLDISRAPAGDYQLMLILYDAATGERLPWADNAGYVPEMLSLGPVVISANGGALLTSPPAPRNNAAN